MRNVSILSGSQTIKIGKEPVVLVPLKLWHQAEDCLEDKEALASRRHLRRIKKARKDIAAGMVVYPFR